VKEQETHLTLQEHDDDDDDDKIKLCWLKKLTLISCFSSTPDVSFL